MGALIPILRRFVVFALPHVLGWISGQIREAIAKRKAKKDAR
jgi:hypothetical protein